MLPYTTFDYNSEDGIYFNIRNNDAKQCILVIVGVTHRGDKEFLAIEDGYRESEQSRVGPGRCSVSRSEGLDHPSWLWVMEYWVSGQQ